MARQNFLFITTCLVLLTGLLQAYFLFERHFDPHQDDVKKIARLSEALEEKNLQIAQLENQMVDFQQEVAVQLPALQKIDRTPKTFQLRSLASVTQKPLNAFEMSGALNEKARAEFRKGDYAGAARSFSNLAQKYPASPVVIQAYFFWAESLYLNNQHQECLDVIDQMMTLFPDHELTGFIMLRMGQILQARSRTEEASEVFKVVSKTFAKNSELKTQADKLSKAIE